jgi:G:T-mismatch repair DNA endonuclease (very short patch repair protein)
MTIVFDKQKRSEVKSKIRSKSTKLELTLRKALLKVGRDWLSRNEVIL